MKVLDLTCPADHHFEGWFGSDADFEDQLSRRLVACPICNSTELTRLPSAPRLNLSGAIQAERAAGRNARQPQSPASQSAPQSVPQTAAGAQGAWLTAVRQVLAQTENVGERFADEARRMHYEEAPARNIRGVASRDQFRELLEEGIEVLPLAIPDNLKEPLQ
ncbi:DUF1178 family protein [Burkholderia sp. L27(2015)]|uniref:DUF1178 family protein n=1 Tax=Burkholderia sp. L27(2015) TaxID=1641858 RepID=UPI00131B1DB7|nr:DUF1178 family protein [Burkholderia sp. L27(2015)]